MQETTGRFALCLDNTGYPASLDVRKVYPLLPTTDKEKGYLRVIDESGEDYLYPAIYFYPVELPQAIRETFRIAA